MKGISPTINITGSALRMIEYIFCINVFTGIVNVVYQEKVESPRILIDRRASGSGIRTL